MKNLLFMLVLFGFLFISQADVFAQKKSKKIETWEVFGSVDLWYLCKEDGYPIDYCVDKVKIKFTNNSNQHISKITFKLIIKSKESIIYKKQHSVNVDIDAGETVPYDIKLSGKANGYQGQDTDDFRDEIEIKSVK